MVFYLKYRPQKISDLDSAEVRGRLLKILSSDNLPHAFLFTGPKGLGKTSAARIIAKTVNCEKRKKGDPKPCGKCESCRSITAGTNLDVLEIDGASNRGIDEIRDLREKIRLSPVQSLKKVYIIDEVHMLTTEAFNALLKTLEEPPAHALFVLCTTEPQKVPATIVSRCLHISFKSPTSDEMKRSFKRIVKGEELNLSEDAISEVIKLSDKSFRDGAKILEEISISFGKKKVGKVDIESLFNTSSINKSCEDLIIAVSKNDAKKGLEILDNLSKQKIDFKFFTENLLGLLHDVLLVKFGVNSTEEAEKFLNSIDIEGDDLKKYIQEFSDAYSKLRFSVSPQIPLEIAVIELTSQGPERNTAAEVKKVIQTENKNISNNGNILTELISKVNEKNRMVAGILRGVRIDREEGDNLFLLASSKFHKERLDDLETHKLIEEIYFEITGKKGKIEVNLKV